MFGIRQDKTKELEEQLSGCETQLAAFKRQLQEIREAGRNTQPHFEAQIASHNEMDQELTRVVGYAHDTIAASEENRELVEQLALGLTEIRTQLEQAEQKRAEHAAQLDRQKDQLIAVVEENSRFTAPVKSLQQVQGDFTQELARARECAVQMGELGKQMSVLSLNCAIEAGRMGDSGREFIGAAQDVRNFAGLYEKAAEQLAGQLANMEQLAGQLGRQTGELTGYLKDNNVSMQRLTKEFTGTAESAQAPGELFSAKTGGLTEQLRQLTRNQEDIAALQKKTLGEMENIGACFMDEQTSRKEIEQIFEKIKASL